jgi:uncharacterized protein (TIGR03083 family)
MVALLLTSEADMDPWDAINQDRQAFAGYLATLSPEDWKKPTWCEQWSVKAVASHLLVPPTMSKGQVFLSFLKAGFNLDKMSATLIAGMDKAMSNEDIVTTTRSTAGVRSAPPGLKPLGVFSEILVHASDISLAIGKPFDFPIDHYVIGLNYMKDVQPVLGCKKRIAGLKLKAEDTDWSTGDGPLVEGSAKLLLSAMTGRPQALVSLRGDGVAVLRGR